MASKSTSWAITLTLLPVFAYGACLPGQDISARAEITFSQKTQAHAGATIAYTDPTGNPGEESPGEPASVDLETTSGVECAAVTSFVLPDESAHVYFTNTRSFYLGASLEGKCVKLLGRFRTANNVHYLDDGAVLLEQDPLTGQEKGIPCPVILRTDLLTSLPADNDRIVIQGVCRRETNGSLALLPLSNSAIDRVR
jgi:hypothetical protein